MRFRRWVPLLLSLALAACAQQAARSSSTQHVSATIDYAKYAQDTVPWFQFASLYDWNSNQPSSVVVWTSPRQAYLLSLAGPCMGLQGAFTIGLTSHTGLVSSNRDYVIAHQDRCAIMRIQRLDAKAIRALRTKPKSSSETQG